MANLLEQLAEMLAPSSADANRLAAPNMRPPNLWRGPDQDIAAERFASMPANQTPPAGMSASTSGQSAPDAAGYSGSGFLGGIGDLFDGGQRRRENETVNWLKQQGLDEGTAVALTNNPPLLQSYLRDRMQGGRGEGFTLGEGQVRYDQAGNVIAQGPAKSKNELMTDDIKEYMFAKQQGFPGTYQDWEASKKGGMSLQVDPETGAVTFQQGGNIKPLTEGQSKDTVYATRAAGAMPLVEQYEGALTNFGEAAAGNLPFGAGNYLKSEEYQKAEQAGREFLAAILRKDSGGAITPDENSVYGAMYLPQPGDKPGTIEQKRAARQRAVEAIKAGMSPQALLFMEQALSKNAPPAPPAPPSGASPSSDIDLSGDKPPPGWGGDPDLWKYMPPEDRKLWLPK